MLLHDRNEKSTVNNGVSMLNKACVSWFICVIKCNFPDAGLFGYYIRSCSLHNTLSNVFLETKGEEYGITEYEAARDSLSLASWPLPSWKWRSLPSFILGLLRCQSWWTVRLWSLRVWCDSMNGRRSRPLGGSVHEYKLDDEAELPNTLFHRIGPEFGREES